MEISQNLNSETSWELAREYATALGRFPNVFSAAVRLLISDHQHRGGELRPVTKYLVSHALRGKKILSMLYYSGMRLRNDELKDKESLSLGQLVNLYEPYDLAAIYATYLLYRRTRSQHKMDLVAFRTLIPHFQKESQMGGCVGAAIPKIGIGNGTLAGSIHHLALAIIALSYSRRAEQYTAHLTEKSLRFDQLAEFDIFGCTTAQVGSIILAKLGFSNAAVDPYYRGMDPVLKLAGALNNSTNPVRFGRMWLDCVIDSKDQPIESVPGDYYPTSAARDWLQDQLSLVHSNEPSWFERDNEDVSPEKTPVLFVGTQKNKDVPEQLRDIFTMKEISEMGEAEFDALVDQIDKNIEDGTINEKLSVCEPEG